MKQILGVALLQLSLLNGIAQQKSSYTLKTDKSDTYILEKYAPNIYKIIYKPVNYHRNENISDAVILQKKPVENDYKDFKISENGMLSFKGISFTGDSMGQMTGFRIQLAPGEMIFGGGERALPLNRRGYRFMLNNNPWYGYSMGADNLNFSVPFFMSSRGYGIFFDNPSRGVADIGKSDETQFIAGFTSGEINYYIIFGEDYQQILKNYHDLTGRQPLPPRWALGNFMSRFGYVSQQQLESIYDSFKVQQIPVDAVIIDLFWFGDSIKGTLGNLDWVNRKAWPQPAKMIADLKKDKVNTILITEPFVLEGTKSYPGSLPYLAVDKAGKPFTLTDFYFGRGGIIDIFKPSAQNWFWKKYKKQMDMGVAGWWGDLGEPEKHPNEVHHNLKSRGVNRLMSADEVHNLYGHTWTKMLYEKFAIDFPKRRLFSLNRSGFGGSQRYGIMPWSGDVSRSWSGMQAQLPIMLGMSMSGIPYIHADAGGFAGGDKDWELYLRWNQFAAFTPILRPHGTALGDRDPSNPGYASELALIPEPYRSLGKKSVALRYQLLPYNYTLAYKQSKNGEPLVAPLYYYYPKDSMSYKVESQFFWGSNLLVCPVLYKGDTSRAVYLPEGQWYDFHNPAGLLEGGKIYVVKLEADKIPVYVKAGSFIPFWDRRTAIENTAGFGPAEVVVRYYPSQISSSDSWYNDDGETKNIAGEILKFSASKQNDRLNIVVQGRMKGMQNLRMEIMGNTDYKIDYKGLKNGGIDKGIFSMPMQDHKTVLSLKIK